MKQRIYFFFSFLLLSQLAAAAVPESFGVIAPYVGNLSSRYENAAYKLNLDESGTMTGLFGQWIHKDFQANTFFYYAPEANMTDVLGLHLNADFYPADVFGSKIAVGADVERIHIHTSGSVRGLESLEVNNTVLTLMPRAGLMIEAYRSDTVTATVFPYLGAVYEDVSGEVSVDPMGPTPKMSANISENSTYASLGFNLTTRFFHFLELHGKYLAGFKSAGRLDSISAMANVFLSKSIALSYRFKNIELPKRSNQYHLVGLAVVL